MNEITKMKNLINTLSILFLAATISFATADPKAVISNDDVEVVNLEESSIFTTAEYNYNKNNLEFETSDQVEMIQIYDETGKITFQLNVDSRYVRINKNLFDSGKSKLGFKMKSTDNLHFTSVTIN